MSFIMFFAHTFRGVRFIFAGGRPMRIGVIGIVIEKDRTSAVAVNEVLSAYGDYIIGRMGVPDKENEVYVISVIVKASNEIFSAMTGKLGKILNVKVKSAVTSCEVG